MKLTIKERFLTFPLLPEKGDITTIRQVRMAREALGFSDQEHRDFGIQRNTESQQITWSPEANAKQCDVELAQSAKDMIGKRLQEISTEGNLTPDMVTLWDKFVGKIDADSDDKRPDV